MNSLDFLPGLYDAYNASDHFTAPESLSVTNVCVRKPQHLQNSLGC
jgi:hypothetical protein